MNQRIIQISFRNFLFFFIFTFVFSSCTAQKATKSSDKNILLNNKELKNAHIGICLFDVKADELKYKYQSDKYFIPASNTKIATCYAALKYLGDSTIGLKYAETDSTLFIKTTGDPSFLYKPFKNQSVLNWLQTKSAKKIVFINPTFLTTPYGKGWSWEDFEEPFMAERSAFPMYGNLVQFSYQNGYKTNPKIFESNIVSSFEASNSDVRFDVTKKLNQNQFKIIPGKNVVKSIPFTISSNDFFAFRNLLSSLIKDTLHTEIIFQEDNNQLDFQSLYSQHLDTSLRIMMHTSDNFIAEQILLMVSNEKLGLMSDNVMIDSLLKNDFSDLPQKPKWVDGSGLSRYNLQTPENLVEILKRMKSEFDWSRIKLIFPSGNEGTLKPFLSKLNDHVYAKTGSLSNNFSLSGYLIAKSGKEFIFSIMINNHMTSTLNIKQTIEKYLTTIIDKN